MDMAPIPVDEMVDGHGGVRPHWRRLLGAISDLGHRELLERGRQMARALREWLGPRPMLLERGLIALCVLGPLGFALLLPAAFLLGQTRFEPTPLAWAGLAFQSVLVCFVSFLVWFWLLTQYLASRLGVFSFMTPIFGVVFGAWLLSEPIEPNFLAGALMVLAGVLLVSGYGWLMSLRR